MSHALRQSARIRAIAWRDLAALRPVEQVKELLLPLPFLLAARAAFAFDVPVVPWLASAYFFLAGLRLVHDAFHDNLALRRPAGHALLAALSAIMLGFDARGPDHPSPAPSRLSRARRRRRPDGAAQRRPRHRCRPGLPLPPCIAPRGAARRPPIAVTSPASCWSPPCSSGWPRRRCPRSSRTT